MDTVIAVITFVAMIGIFVLGFWLDEQQEKRVAEEYRKKCMEKLSYVTSVMDSCTTSQQAAAVFIWAKNLVYDELNFLNRNASVGSALRNFSVSIDLRYKIAYLFDNKIAEIQRYE